MVPIHDTPEAGNTVSDSIPVLKNSAGDQGEMLQWIMSLASRIVFEGPHGRHNINLQMKCRSRSLSETEAMEMFGDEDLSCTSPNCGWHGKASKTRLLRILPFN